MIYRHQHSHVSPNLGKEFPNRPIHPSSRLNNSPSENNISVLGIILRRHKEKPLGLNFPLQPQLWIIRQTRKQNVDELKRRETYKKNAWLYKHAALQQICTDSARFLHCSSDSRSAEHRDYHNFILDRLILLSGIMLPGRALCLIVKYRFQHSLIPCWLLLNKFTSQSFPDKPATYHFIL